MTVIARLDNEDRLITVGELCEYPKEIEGTKNIITNSRLTKDMTPWGTGCKITKQGIDYVKVECGSSNNFGVTQSIPDMTISYIPNTDYTISFEARGNIVGFNYNYLMRRGGSNRRIENTLSNLDINIWNKFVITANTRDFFTESGYLLIGSTNVGIGKYFEIRNMKIEIGNNPNPLWTPNPIDINIEIPSEVINLNVSIGKSYTVLPEVYEYPLELKGKRNLISKSDLSINGGVFYVNDYLNGKLGYQLTGKYGGIRFNAKALSPNMEYTLSFSYKKTGGTLLSFGGHTDPAWTNNKVYLNGIDTDKRYTDSTSCFSDDNELVHKVSVEIETPKTINQNDLIYIQPNRGLDIPVSIEVYNLKLVSGKVKSEWSLSPEDLGINYPIYIDNFIPTFNADFILVSEYVEKDFI